MSGAVRNSKSQWHLLYYLIAGFDLLTILASLYLSHTLLNIHSTALDHNTEWVQRFEQYERLASTLSRVNAPGNDVFDSQDVAAESSRLEAELKPFRALMRELDHEADAIRPEQRELLRTELKELNTAMDAMLVEAQRIFSYFRQNDRRLAGTRMATMDREYAQLNRQMAEIRGLLRTFQKQDLTEQRNKAASLSRFEYAFAGMVILILCFVTLYGHGMAKRMARAQKLIEDQQTQIQTSAKLSALGEMAGGVAHEMNNPLATVKLRAEQLKEIALEGEADNAFVIDTAEEIAATAARMAKIVKGLRTFARDGSYDPLQPENVRAIVDDTLALCRDRASGMRVELRANLPPAELQLSCRATDISQVLLNLIGNALDAIAGSPSPWIQLDVNDLPDRLEITVTDSGSGIPEGHREKIMQPFFTTKAVGKGTGLGLSISKGLMEAHGGVLSLDTSCPNTRFVLTFPKAPAEQKPAIAA